MSYLKILYVALVVGVSSDPHGIIKPCKKEDAACMTESAKYALPRILDGIPALGIETSDPLNVDEIVGDLMTLKFRFTENIVTGFKNCDIYNAKLDLGQSTVNFNLTCLNIDLHGKYTIKGRLIILPVEGEGPYHFHINKYVIGFNGEVKQVTGQDGKTYIIIKKYKVDADAQDGITYDLQNLFNGQKELADTLLKFANENWKEVADLVHAPVIATNVKIMIGNINKFLKTVPIEELLL